MSLDIIEVIVELVHISITTFFFIIIFLLSVNPKTKKGKTYGVLFSLLAIIGGLILLLFLNETLNPYFIGMILGGVTGLFFVLSSVLNEKKKSGKQNQYEEFLNLLLDYSHEVNVTINIKKNIPIVEEKFLLWRRLSTLVFRIDPHYYVLDEYRPAIIHTIHMIFGGLLIGEIIFGGISTLIFNENTRILEVRITSWKGIWYRLDEVLSTYIYIYIFLYGADLKNKGYPINGLSAVIMFCHHDNNPGIEKDGIAFLDTFKDNVTPSPERLDFLKQYVIKKINSKNYEHIGFSEFHY